MKIGIRIMPRPSRMKDTMSAIRNKLKAAGLRPPKMVTLMMTNGCNLKCRHCWPESRSPQSVQPVPAETLKRLIHESAGLEAEEICLAGGEPFTHPDWYSILKYACDQSQLKRVTLQTNAALLDDAKLRALDTLDCESLMIQVSLDGAGSKTHDRVRGEGSFELTFGALQRLSEMGLGKQTQVAFTEMKHNFEELPRILELSDDLDLTGCVSGTLVPQGRAKRDARIAPPTPSQCEKLLSRYRSDATFRARYERLGNIAALEWFKGRNHPFHQGCICIETPYIDSEGRIYPCRFLPAEEFAVKGAHDRCLETVMLEAIALWARLPGMDRRRRNQLKPCKACPGQKHCAGGCMGRAYAASGDFTSVEDRCALRKAVYSWNK
jgi:radical SAM protein with 4Fe4S-binding SPASM domain